MSCSQTIFIIILILFSIPLPAPILRSAAPSLNEIVNKSDVIAIVEIEGKYISPEEQKKIDHQATGEFNYNDTRWGNRITYMGGPVLHHVKVVKVINGVYPKNNPPVPMYGLQSNLYRASGNGRKVLVFLETMDTSSEDMDHKTFFQRYDHYGSVVLCDKLNLEKIPKDPIEAVKFATGEFHDAQMMIEQSYGVAVVTIKERWKDNIEISKKLEDWFDYQSLPYEVKLEKIISGKFPEYNIPVHFRVLQFYEKNENLVQQDGIRCIIFLDNPDHYHTKKEYSPYYTTINRSKSVFIISKEASLDSLPSDPLKAINHLLTESDQPILEKLLNRDETWIQSGIRQ